MRMMKVTGAETSACISKTYIKDRRAAQNDIGNKKIKLKNLDCI